MGSLISGLAGGALKGLAGKLGAGAKGAMKFLDGDLGSTITESVGGAITGISSGQDAASALISSGLDIASSLPGPIGWAGKALNIGNMILGNKMNLRETDIDDSVKSSTGFNQITEGADSINSSIGKQNAKGGYAKLFGSKSRNKLKNKRNQLETTARNAGIELNQGASDIAAATNEASYDTSWIDGLNNARGTLGKTSMFKKGGKIDVEDKKDEDVNVIVDGALHAHKHNMEDLDVLKDANITKKGVPVIVNEEGGEIKQVAEFETGEIVLHKTLTEKLEDLAKDGSKEDKIKAGKLLVYEILNNTIDNSEKLLENE